MTRSIVRLLIYVFVGMFAGTVLGFLLVPDPTSPLAPGLALLLGGTLSGGLYWIVRFREGS